MRNIDKKLEELMRLARMERVAVPPASKKLEDDVIRAWRGLPQNASTFVRDLSIAFVGAFSIAMACFVVWLGTTTPISSEESAFEDSLNELYSMQ